MKKKYEDLLSFDDFLKDQLQDPEFKKLWDEGEPRRQVISALIGERIKRKMTQAEVAKKAGIKQPSLARLETSNSMPTLTLLSKVANALDLKMEIRFVPKR
jgi:DNA-binding XRE family transcriptional regulator